jgi:hypothetical protein
LKQILDSIFDKISPGGNTFKYQAIKLDKGIRLVTLHRRLPWLQVHIGLEEVSLDSAPPYEAISYTWGENPKMIKKIFVNGLPFYTTPSTFNVLRTRSSPWKTRVLWIDSICINQDDLEERSSQVLLMGEIYRRCSRAVVCLGGGFGSVITSIAAMSLIHDLASDSSWDISTMRTHEREKNVFEFLSLLRLLLLVILLRNPWFSRVWVVQEVAHPKIVHVVYGGLYLDWSSFEKMAEAFIQSEMTRLMQAAPGGHEARAAVNNIHIMVTIRRNTQVSEKFQGVQQMLRQARMLNFLKFPKLLKEDAKMGENKRRLSSLRGLLKQFADLKCSNDLDKVYALLGLTTDGSHRDFIPDYTKRPETLFVEVALHLLAMDHPFRVLCSAGIGHQRKCKDLPSWAPDWTTPPKGAEFDFANHRYPKGTYTASGESQAQMVCHREDKTLLVGSIFVDEIAFLGSLCSIRTSRGDIQVDSNLQSFDRSGLELDVAWYTETLQLATAHAKPPLKTRANLTESLWRTLAADIDISTRPAPASLGDAYACWVQLLEHTRDFVLRHGQVPNDEDFWTLVGIADRWGVAMGQGCSERKFCVTKGGYIGLVPPGSEVGDQIWVFLGAPTPYVLRRKTPNNVQERPFGELTFALVGECYVDEMMDGEILEKERKLEYVTLV